METNVAAFYKANVGLIHAVSKKGYARLQAAGIGLDYDDVFQEMSVVFLKAVEGFDETKGFKFATYFYMAAFNKLNTWAQAQVTERLKHGVVSIQELSASAGEEDFNMEEVLFVDDATPEHNYRIQELLNHIASTLSPLAGLMLMWSVMPPQEVLTEIRKALINAEFGRSKGLNSRCMKNISPRYIGDFLELVSGVKRSEITKALKEIEALRTNDVRKFIGD